jgi:hypothetical protein
LKPLVNQHFYWWFSSANLLWTVTADLDSWNQSTHLASSTWDAILTIVSVALRMERFGNSSGTNYELHQITH